MVRPRTVSSPTTPQAPYGQQPPYGQQNPYGQPQYSPQPYAQPLGGFNPAPGDPGSLDLPWYGIGMGDAVKRVFAKYAVFDGRASRGEFWFWALANFLISLVFIVFGVVLPIPIPSGLILLFLVICQLAVLVPSLAVAVRRLHDAGYSGWMYFITFVPAVGGIILIVLLASPSKPEGMLYDKPSTRPVGY